MSTFIRACAAWLPSASLLLAATTASAQELTVTLTGSMHNGTEIPCFGKKEGTVTSSVSGGTAPYTYLWTNGATGTSISGVAAGYYSVEVKDAEGVYGRADITLTEPEALKVSTVVSAYTNGHNISCFECSNGYVQVTPTQGTPPYTYAWADGPYTTRNRYTLGPGEYSVTVTDANGCAEKANQKLTQPEPSGWGMEGNTGTNPATQFIGTSDSTDVVFRANGQESARLGADGSISLLGDLQGEGVLMRDASGKVRIGGDMDLPVLPVDECRGVGVFPPWSPQGNNFPQLCPNELPRLGTLSATPLRVVTNGVERMRIITDGKVGIGTTAPQDQFEVHTTLERSGITLNNARNDANAHLEFRFKKNGALRWAMGTDFEGNGGQDFFLWDHQATMKRLEVNAQGKVGIGTVPPLNGSNYLLYVGGGITTRDVKVTAGDWPDFVFADGYRLMPLSELRAFLARHRHLPGIPSAAEVERNEGIELGDMQARLLKVVEEQALYILQLEERQERMEQRIKALEERGN